MTQNYSAHFVQVGPTRLAYEDRGHGTPEVVLFHGFAANLTSWALVAPALAHSFRVVAWDRPGFGQSELPRDERRRDQVLSAAGSVEITLGAMDALRLRSPIVLAGHSAGAAAAAEAALAAQNRVAGLVLEAPAIGNDLGPPELVKKLIGSGTAAALAPLVLRTFAPRLVGPALRLAYHDPANAHPMIVEGWQRAASRSSWADDLWAVTTAWRATDLQDRLSQIQIPVLVVTGDDDRIVSGDRTATVVKALDDVELVTIPACGHLPHEERPEEFLRVVTAFIKEKIGGPSDAALTQ